MKSKLTLSLLLLVLVLTLSVSAKAQDYSKAEAFLGYSYIPFGLTRTAGIPFTIQGNLNGGVGQVTFNANKTFGIVADFSGYSISNLSGGESHGLGSVTVSGRGSVISYLFGPRVSMRSGRLTSFAQVLFGGAHIGNITSSFGQPCAPSFVVYCTVSKSASENGFAMSIGGGIDVKAAKHVSIRLGQAEYLLTRFQTNLTGMRGTPNNFRYSAGIVLH